MSHLPRLGNTSGKPIHLALCSVFLVAACRGSPPQPVQQETARQAPNEAPTAPPANVSHGEAPIGVTGDTSTS